MSTLKTYRRAIAVVVVAVALALGCAGAATTHAWASVGSGALGVNVEVPSTVEQRPGAGDGAVKGGSGSLLGVNVQVPDRLAPDGGTSGSTGKVSGAASLLGVNVQVPSTIEQRPGGSDDPVKGGSASLLGVNVQVPDPAAPDPENPDDPGASTTGKVSGASSLLGINVEVPSTVEQRPGEEGGPAGGSESVLGVNVKVPEGLFVSFVANGGQGAQTVQIAGTKAISADLGRFSWPGREIVGWYTSAACRDDEFVMAADGTVPEELVKAGARFYAKWSVTDPRAVGTVELHLVESEAAGGNDTSIPADELAACGIQPAGYAEDTGLTAADNAPVYTGGWYPGGDGTVWPLPEDASAADVAREGATLQLPTPVMEERKDESGVRNGIFEGWYKTRTEVRAADGTLVRYDYSDPVEQADGAWRIGKFDAGTGEDGEPPYHQVLYAKWRTGTIHTFTFDADGGTFADGSQTKAIQVADGDRASAGAVDAPTREGHAFTGWWTAPDGEPRQKYAFSTLVRHPTTVYAGWEKNRYVVAFDSMGGSSVSSRTVEHGACVDRPADPTRYGYDFEGWYTDPACTDDSQYDFGSAVTGGFTLYAKWKETETPPEPPKEKLDVTVPVSIGFAVNADTGEVVTPDMGAYALKSRSERAVAVERLDLTTEQGEMEGFFSLKDAADGGTGPTAWQDALRNTSLLLRSDRAQGDLRLAFAQAGAAGGPVWESGYALTQSEKDGAYTIEAFDPTGADPGEQWWLTDACNRLNLKFGMEVPEELKVRTDIDGQRKITHLKVTVSTVGAQR